MKNYKQFFIYIAILILISSCKITGIDGGELNPPGSGAFLYYGSAPAIDFSWNVTTYDTYAFVADGNSRISIYDILDSTQPRQISSINLPSGSQPIKAIEVDWRYNLYVAGGNGGLHIINCSDPGFPVLVASYPNIYATGLSFQDDYLAVIDNNGWRLFYLTGSSYLTEVGSYIYFMNRQPLKIHMQDNWVFVASHNTLEIFDITNPSNIRLEKNFSFSNFIDFDFIDNYLTLITNYNLYFIDISNPLNASLSNYFELLWTPVMIRNKDNHIFISWENRSLSAYKVWSINIVREVSRKNFTQTVWDISFKNNVLYLANGNEGLKVYNFIK